MFLTLNLMDIFIFIIVVDSGYQILYDTRFWNLHALKVLESRIWNKWSYSFHLKGI